MSNRYSLSYSPNLSARLGQLAHGFVPGFVWEEDGSIIGNATLLQSDIPNRYLVANVAVHPDYRRRGIAKGLMTLILISVARLRQQQEELMNRIRERSSGPIPGGGGMGRR